MPDVHPYGHLLEPELHRLLRGRPPRAALDWATAAAGAHSVLEVRPLPGGTSSAVHRLTLQDATGTSRQVVLRRYVRDWVRSEPEAPGNEVAVLSLLAGTPVPAPRLVAADLDGSATGVPAVLMTALPGRLVWAPARLAGRLPQLVQVLAEIHAGSPGRELGGWSPYPPPDDLVPPPWTRHRQAWERALELYAGPPPPSSRVLLHRDFHPGNVLWSGPEVSGVVDWVAGCVGPPEVDVAHCRWNLAVHAGSPAAADRFLRIWQTLTGRPDWHPYWDLTTVVSMVDAEPDPALDAFVAAAADRL